jgi:hypothetical protein
MVSIAGRQLKSTTKQSAQSGQEIEQSKYVPGVDISVQTDGEMPCSMNIY